MENYKIRYISNMYKQRDLILIASENWKNVSEASFRVLLFRFFTVRIFFFFFLQKKDNSFISILRC